MSKADRPLRVFPDGDRVEHALLAAAERSDFVDASGYLSFSQLVERCEGARALGRRPCSPLVARGVLSAVAQALPQGPFKAFAQEPAFARAALELVFDLKAGGCSPADLTTAIGAFPEVRRARARYLCHLYAGYDEAMARLRLADREDLLRGAVEAMSVKGAWARLFGAFNGLEMSHLHDFTPLRIELMLALAARCQEAGVAFRLELPGSGNPEVDGLVDAVHRAFEARWEQLEVDVVKQEPRADRPLSGLAANLFSSDRATPPLQSAPALAAFSTATPREECRELAGRARDLVDSGVPPEAVVISFRDLGSEAEMTAEALEAYGVPVRLRLGAPLSATAVGRLALELPLLIDEGYPADRLVTFLESRYAPALSGAPGVARWLSLASARDDRLGAEAGRGAYRVRLSALSERLERTGDLMGARKTRAVLERVERLLALGAQLPAEGRAAELLGSWWRCVEALGLLSAVRRREPRAEEGAPLGRAVLRALARDQAATEALRELASELAEALSLSGAGKQRLSRRAFHRWLIDAARDFNLAPRGPRAGAVRVLDVRELPGSRCHHLLLGGMTDGRFPGRVNPSTLFPDDDRARVNRSLRRGVFRLGSGDLDGKLPWRLAEDRLLLHLAFCASEGTTTLSFSRRALDGQPQARSPFLDELARATGLEVPSLALAAVKRLADARSEPELREAVALAVFSRPALRVSDPDPAAGALGAALAGEGWLQSAGALSRIEEERLRFFSDPAVAAGPFSGSATDPALQAALQQAFAFDQGRPLTASSLGRFGNCAFQGFLATAIGLEEPDDPGEEIDSRTQGSFWHQVLEALFPRLAKAGVLGKPAEEVPDVLLDEALADASERAEQRLHVGHPALWKLGRFRARAMVRRLLNAQPRGLPFEGHLPQATEVSFGKPTSEEPWREIRLAPAFPGETPIHFRGSIDRIDATARDFALLDYKSGKLKSAKKGYQALLETDFQLPLYLFAARASGQQAPLRAAWLSLRDGEALHLDQVLSHGPETLDELLTTAPDARLRLKDAGKKNFANAVHHLVQGLREGNFPARSEDCEQCSYRPVCRVSERGLEELGDV